MHAKRSHSADRRRRIILRCALALLLCSVASKAHAQTSVAASPRREGASANASRETSRITAAINAGRIVFNQRCAICHFVDSDAQKIGPGLKGLFTRAKLADGTKVTEASIAKIIAEGGKDMPDYQGLLKAGQLQALIAYLKSAKP